jgi:hypothetical protein
MQEENHGLNLAYKHNSFYYVNYFPCIIYITSEHHITCSLFTFHFNGLGDVILCMIVLNAEVRGFVSLWGLTKDDTTDICSIPSKFAALKSIILSKSQDSMTFIDVHAVVSVIEPVR